MKRFWIILTACCMLFAAVPAQAQVYDFSGAFTVNYPDHWEMDPDYDTTGNTETYQCLGAVYTPASCIEVCISDDRAYYDDYSVPLTKNSDYFGYVSGMMSMLEETEYILSCEYVDGWLNEQGNAQFVIFYADDGEGGYYYADTMLGGCTLSFYAYSNSMTVDTGARQMAELETLIHSIVFSDALFEE